MRNIKTINEQEVISAWSETIKESLGADVNYNTLRWVSKVIDNQAKLETINEDVAVRGEISGQGEYMFPTAGNQGTNTSANGSGDTFKSLLPITMEVAGATVGFDIVTVFPVDSPGGVIPYIDYVYSNVYSADKTADTKEVIALEFDWASGATAVDFVLGTAYTLTNSETSVGLTYTGTDRLNNSKKHFVVTTAVSGTGSTIGDILDGTITMGGVSVDDITATFVTAAVNHVQGYTAPGADNVYTSNETDGTRLFNPMSRGVGENTQSKSIGLKTYTKPVDIGTISVDAKVTREQLKDLPTQFGIDIIALVKDVLVEELSQTINMHILSEAFALGWANHDNLGKSLNLNISVDAGTVKTYVRNDGTQASITTPASSKFIDTASSAETQNSAHNRIQARVLAISNLIHKRGRRGPGNFVVTNLQVASALQASSKFSVAPIVNTLSQTAMSMYQYGTISGMPVYVDPNMGWDDTRVLVGRKGSETEPGLKFVPYVLAESIEIIAESSMSPRIEMYSRYDLVETGHHPEAQYFTFFVQAPAGGLV